jgi:hypothetical protein
MKKKESRSLDYIVPSNTTKDALKQVTNGISLL